MLTGEYLVLKGATALALPLNLGQDMCVDTLDDNDGRIYWNASIKSTDIAQRHWFSSIINKNDFSIVDTDNKEISKRLSDILSEIKSLNDNVFNDSHDYRFSTILDFDPHWGLGSSSTLINNLSKWAQIDPYKLLESTFKGSGYDIACAASSSPIFYKIKTQQTSLSRQVSSADFNPDFKDMLYFVYHGHKQNSAKEVKAFLGKDKDYENEISAVSEISESLPKIKNISDFCYLMKMHEDIISSCISHDKIGDSFPDFEGQLKSLGAWGGDFFMAATNWDEMKVRSYFENKGHNIILKYKDIIYKTH